MKFSADCSFHIGAQHLRSGLPCQDYAATAVMADGAFAVVSDGCSSGGRTDVGARVVALSAVREMRSGHMPTFQPLKIAGGFLGIGLSDLLATRITMSLTPNAATFNLEGDGVVAYQSERGHIGMAKVEWDRNMPCYPAYASDDFARFKAAHVESSGLMVTACGRIAGDPNPSMSEHQSFHGMILNGWPIVINFPCRAVAAFSDGVCQVDGMTWHEVVLDLMAFRSTAGDFVKRRMNRFLHDAGKRGRGPIDDIAMAAILMED